MTTKINYTEPLIGIHQNNKHRIHYVGIRDSDTEYKHIVEVINTDGQGVVGFVNNNGCLISNDIPILANEGEE